MAVIHSKEQIMKKLALSTALGLSVSACAGGISGGTSIGNGNQNTMVTDYAIETAMLNIYTKPRNQQLMAVVDNQNLTADITVTPKGSMQFNNKQLFGAEVNTINKVNNQVANQSVSINYFTLNPLVFHGYTDSSGKYSVSTQTATIPKLAKVGTSGPLITENVYSDSSKHTLIGRYSQSWSLAQAGNNTAWFCINSSDNALVAVDSDGTSVECYEINSRGDILDSKLTIKIPAANGVQTVEFVSR